MTEARYRPIRDYALIGDCHGSALVSSHGSIDWCCLERFDADPLFLRLLDADRGGFFHLEPNEPYVSTRRYFDGTNILETVFTTDSGAIKVIDFMPVGRRPGSSVHDYVHLNAPCWLVRAVECVEGEVSLRVQYRPSVAFARRSAILRDQGFGVAVDGEGTFLQSPVHLSLNDDLAEGTRPMQQGDRLEFVLSPRPLVAPVPSATISHLEDVTRAFWQEWLAYCRYGGPHADLVRRSALALKLLTYAPTGAIVAAPTTSLPEALGAGRNWDYRYCWPRDVSFTLYALSGLGYSGEAKRFAEFLYGACKKTHPRVQILYGIDGETELHEKSLDHLDGYRGSRPVRVGNGAFDQRQLDVYGELLDWAFLYRTLGGRFDRGMREFLGSIAEFIATEGYEPDQGLWEMRGDPQHFVFGKIMSWVTVDRAIRMFGKRDELMKARDGFRDWILENGVRDGVLVQAFGNAEADASLLLTPIFGFPIDRAILEKTIETIQQQLGVGDYLLRYRGDDLEGNEGAFLVCSFWLVNALLLLGRSEEAAQLYARLLARANDVGLFAEEIHPESDEFLGNFPQALTHLGLIQCAVNFGIYEEHGLEALQGTHADRARINVGATSGWRGIWAAFKKSGRVGRIRSSRASILDLDLSPIT